MTTGRRHSFRTIGLAALMLIALQLSIASPMVARSARVASDACRVLRDAASAHVSDEPSLGPGEYPLETTEPAVPIGPLEQSLPSRLRGRWASLPRAPFGATEPISAWTGDVLIAVKPGGRTATYDPQKTRWAELASTPHRVNRNSPAIWTGRELVLVDRHRHRRAAYSLDLERGRWHEIAAPPFSEMDAVVWTGGYVVGTTPDRKSAAYDPVTDCWVELAQVAAPDRPIRPGWGYEPNWTVASLHWAGDRVIAVTLPENADKISLAILDPESWTWSLAAPSPIRAHSSHPLWAADRLWFLTGDGDLALSNASYDPETDAWRLHEPACDVSTTGALWTGRFIIASDSGTHRALDPVTGECFRLQRPTGRPAAWWSQGRALFASAWTGTAAIHWSGSRSGELPGSTRAGVVFRPARRADQPVQPSD